MFALAWAVIVLSIAAVLIMLWLLQHHAAAKVSSLFFLTPALSTIEGAILFDESLGALAVVTVDGGPLTIGRATVRWLGSMACAFTFGFGFLPMFFTPRRQGLHDLIAGTCVVRRSE